MKISEEDVFLISANMLCLYCVIAEAEDNHK